MYVKTKFFFSINSDLNLLHRHLCSNPKLCLDVNYPHKKFGFNWSKQTKLFMRRLIFLILATLTLVTDTWVAIPQSVLI